MNNGEIILEGEPKEVFQHAEELDRLGIKLPQVTELSYLFKTHQIKEMSEYNTPLTIEEAYIRLVNIFKKRGISPIRYEVKESSSDIRNDEPLIQVKDLWHIYGKGTDRETVALKGINLNIYSGEFVAFVGQNGSGKTTLAKHFIGLLKPTKGCVIVNGKDTRKSRVSELAATVGYCFQNPDHQIFNRTVYDEIAYGPRNLNIPKEEIQERVVEAIKTVGLEGYEKLNPFFLGKGERQKVAVASVLAMRPKVLIVDEPTTGMDWKTSIAMMDLIKKLNQEGMTVIFITHNMEIVAEYARRVVVLFDGQVLLDGPTSLVFSQQNVLIKAFIKPPPITQLSHMLNGYLKTDTVSVKEAYDQIVSLLSR
jgi:energy-coupling factor transport system ATP-binding protein